VLLLDGNIASAEKIKKPFSKTERLLFYPKNRYNFLKANSNKL